MNTATAAEQANVSTSTIRRWCRTGRIAATKVAGRWVIEATATEEVTVDIANGHVEKIGTHEVEVFIKAGFGRADANAPQRWTYVVGGHIDTMPDTTWATGSDALAEARRRLTPGAACGTCGRTLDTWGQCNHCR